MSTEEMSGKYFLGVDTSNYTTSLCLVGEDGAIVSQKRRLLPVKPGEVGLRQSDAVFHHTKALPELSRLLFEEADIDRSCILAVGVSEKPRDAEGSYMPCFLAGVSYASAFSDALGIPLYRFSHQCGHIMAACASCGRKELLTGETLSFHVSGGTTEVLHVSSLQDGLVCRIIGGTNDLNAGQAIDRTGVALGLSFPCGAEMDELSKKSGAVFSPRVSVKDGFCNLSGLQNLTAEMIRKGEKPEDVSKFTFTFLAKTLLKITEDARKSYPSLPVVYAGGVMSNTLIRNTLEKVDRSYFAMGGFSSDNAYGTAVLTLERHFGRYTR